MAAIDFVTTAQCVAQLGIKTEPPGGWLGRAITAASREIIEHCKWGIWQVVGDVQRLDGGRRILHARHARPIVSVTEVLDLAVTPADRVAELAATYEVENAGAGFIVRTDDVTGLATEALWAPGRRRWQVTLTHGYSAATMPESIAEAALGLVAVAWENRVPGATAEKLGDWSITREKGMPESIAGKLSRHRRLVI